MTPTSRPTRVVGRALRRLAGRDTRGFVVFPDQAVRTGSKTVLFFREFTRFQGGHLKIWHYYNHVAASGTHVPYVVFSPGSLWDETNPWKREGQRVLERRDLRVSPDVYFLAGSDWTFIDPAQRDESSVPIINFMQHVRHADPAHDHYRYLAHKAIRICVDPAVESSIRGTGRIRGPVFTIQNGIDIGIEERHTPRALDVLIVAVKRPDIGRRLSAALTARGIEVKLLDELVPRHIVLDGMRNAKTTLFLPNQQEGAYLPPMEGMALGTLVICPDHVGTSYCRDGSNALRPPYDDEHVLAAVERSLAMNGKDHAALIEAGFRTVRTLTLDAEREQFLTILRRVDDLWSREDGA